MDSSPPTPVVPIVESGSPEVPGKPPRVIDAHVSRRIWAEPTVRRWLLLGVLIFLMFAAYAADRLWERHREKQLIETGITVQAKIIAAADKSLHHPVVPGDYVTLELIWPNHPPEDLNGYMAGNGNVGENITIHMDSAEHTRWTDRSQATSLLDSLIFALIALPIIPALLGIGMLHARSLKKLWRTGQAMPAIVFDHKQSSIAPLSYAVRCSMQGSRDRQLFTVYVPRYVTGLQRGDLKKGDLIWVIAPANYSPHAATSKGPRLAVSWMAGRSA